MKNYAILFLLPILMIFNSCTGTRPTNIGLTNGRLLACPSSPNCISSFETDKQHGMDAFALNGSVESAKAKLIAKINEQKRTNIVVNESNYLHVEYTSALMRFVDDVEFYFDPAAKKIHFRSASRLGHSDLGANRKRMEEVKTLLGL